MTVVTCLQDIYLDSDDDSIEGDVPTEKGQATQDDVLLEERSQAMLFVIFVRLCLLFVICLFVVCLFAVVSHY